MLRRGVQVFETRGAGLQAGFFTGRCDPIRRQTKQGSGGISLWGGVERACQVVSDCITTALKNMAIFYLLALLNLLNFKSDFFFKESTVNSLCSRHCMDLELVSSLSRVLNSGTLFQSNVCNLSFPGIQLLSVLSGCSQGELTVLYFTISEKDNANFTI